MNFDFVRAQLAPWWAESLVSPENPEVLAIRVFIPENALGEDGEIIYRISLRHYDGDVVGRCMQLIEALYHSVNEDPRVQFMAEMGSKRLNLETEVNRGSA